MDRPAWSEEEQRQTAAALSLLQRLPPQDLEANLADFHQVAPHLERSLPSYVNRPLLLKRDLESNTYFIACDYNQDAGTHRSPWSNKYFPPPTQVEEDFLYRPSGRLRQLEHAFNEVFDAYKTSYYCGGVSSVYLWDLEDGFAGAFVIRMEQSLTRGVGRGIWDSIHVLEVRELPNSHFTEYKLSSSVLLHMEVGEKGRDETELAGHVTRQAEAKVDRRKKAGEDAQTVHIMHIGRMIEEMENTIRQSFDHLYLAKQREVVHAVRSLDGTHPSGLPAAQKMAETAREEKERRARIDLECKAKEEVDQEVKRHFELQAREEALLKAKQVAEQKAADEAADKAAEEADRKAQAGTSL